MQTPTRCYVEYLQALLGEYVRDFGVDAHAPHPEGHVGVFPTETSKVSCGERRRGESEEVEEAGRCGEGMEGRGEAAILTPLPGT
jgi:hypothetical protein